MKKWSKLVLATMLSAGTLLVSGCIENLEPEGIADLRGAKAELLRAQTALQAAQAAKVEAEAALLLAQAKVQEAIAKQEEAKVAYFEAQALAEQYRAELLNIQNEEARADLEKKIADMEAAMEDAENKALIAAEKFKVEMLEVLKTLAQAQLAYDQALLDIELARNTLTSEQNAYLSSRLTTFLTLKADVVDMTRELEDAAETLAEALAAVDEAELKDLTVRKKQREIAELKAELEGLLEAQAEAEELMNLDPDLTDWDAEKDELQEEIDALEKEIAVFKREANDKYEEASTGIQEIIEKANLYSATTGYAFDLDLTTDPGDPETWGTGLFKKVPGTPSQNIAVPEIAVPLPDPLQSFLGGASFFTLASADYTYGKEDGVYGEFDAAVAVLNLYLNYEWPIFEKMGAAMKESVDAMPEDETYVKNLEKYNDMVAAYKSGDYLAYANKYVYTEDKNYEEGAFDAAVKGYNDALAAFNTAWTAYKTAMESTGADKAKLDELLITKDNAINAASAAKAKAYQAAQDEYDKAYQKYLAANYAHKAAERKRDNDIEVVLGTLAEEVNFTITSAADVENAKTAMNSFIGTYNTAYGTNPPVAGDANYDQYVADKKLYDAYVAALADIAKAETAYNDGDDATLTDPYSIWQKARADHITAGATQTAAKTKADDAYTEAESEAERVYDEAVATYKASLPNLDTYYSTYLSNGTSKAKSALVTAVSTLNTIAQDFFTNLDTTDPEDYVSVECLIKYYAKNDTDGDLTNDPELIKLLATFSDVPYYLVDDEGAFKEIKSSDVVALLDTDEMLDDIDTYLNSYVFNVMTGPSINLAAVLCDDYPLSYPTYEDFLAYYALAASSGTGSMSYVGGTAVGVAEYYEAMIELQDLEDLLAEFDVEAVKAAIAGIEAAKKEFEAYVTEKEAELDAIKKEVEETVPPVIEEMVALKAEYDELDARNTALARRKGTLVTLISTYCAKIDASATELETLMEALKKAYNDVVKKVADKEDEIIEAEDELQDTLDGLVDAVTSAQRDYEDAQAILEMYQAMLDAATDELAKAIALIYGDEALPEDPGTEDPMPEDPGTEDPGTEDPGTEDPGTEDPGTEDPGTGDEGGEEETPAE